MKRYFRAIRTWFTSLNRNVQLILILGLVLVVTGSVMLAVFSGDATEEITQNNVQEPVEQLDVADTVSATLSTVEGTIEFSVEVASDTVSLREDATVPDQEWQAANAGQEIVQGTSIRSVGATSRAVVQFEDGSEARLDANSELTIETLSTDRIVIVHTNGHVFHRVVTANSDSFTYIVRTKQSQYEAVGTAFRTIASGDEEAVEVFENSVNEAVNDKEVDEGTRFIAVSNVDPAKSNTEEPLDIEQLKNDAFIAWNRDRDTKDEKFRDKLGFLNDIEGPVITITDPQPSQTVTVSNSTSNPTVVFKGTLEKDATLTIASLSSSSKDPITVPIDENGAFTSPAILAPIGNSVFRFVAKDKTGNTTTETLNFTIARAPSTQQVAIALSVDDTDDKDLSFDWGLVGLTTPDGVKLVYNTTGTPDFDDDSSIYVDEGSSLSVKKSEFSKDTYFFRVCRYIESSNTCDVYSNEVEVDLSEESTE